MGVNSGVQRAVIEIMSIRKAQPLATVVILAWNAWPRTRACLDSLLSTLRPGDQVVVVDDGSSDETAAELANYPWVEVVSNELNRGFSQGCNQGAVLASGEVLVFLNNDTIVLNGWLEELLFPFSDPEVGAVGPRSNNVSGVQNIEDVVYEGDAVASIIEFGQDWHRANVGRTSESPSLAGFCLAVRADTFRAIGGFDEGYAVGGLEDDDLCMKLRTAGFRLLVAHGCFVHHESRATFDANGGHWSQRQLENQRRFEGKWGTSQVAPLSVLSACLIVKDEEEMLLACLESIADVVDEIIVYDTGSTDRTVEIARAAGARVIEGYWDDSFARARNAALKQACGDWILSIDADEVLLCDTGAVRKTLMERSSGIEAYLIAIENLHGAGNARSVHTAVRLFRRNAAEWRHRLHEQVVASDDSSRRLHIGYLSGARLIHHGYAAEVFESKNKAERNLALAEASLDDEGQSPAYALMNYGRALESAGRSTEAVDTLREALKTVDDPSTHRLAVKNLIHILGRLERYDEALEEIEELRRISVSRVAADIAEGNVRIAMGDTELGLSLLARVPWRGRDDEGMEYAAHTLAAIRGDALASLGRFSEAADVVLEAVRDEGILEADLGELVRWLEKSQRSTSEIAGALDADDLMGVLGRVLPQTPPVADMLLEGIWVKFPQRLEPLAAAGRLGPRLNVARALVWSSRLRQRGLASACPLVAIANDPAVDPHVRILAGAAAFGVFGERAIVNAVRASLGELDREELEAATKEIERMAPGLLEARHEDALEVVPVIQSVSPPPLPSKRATSSVKVQPLVAAAPRRGGVNIVGPFGQVTREGDVVRSVARSLASHGVAVSTTSYHADGRRGGADWTHRDQSDHPYATTLFVLSPEELADYAMDNGVESFEGRYVIGMWLWDYEQPTALMDTSARMVHEIWVPSLVALNAVRHVTKGRVERMLLPVAPSSHDTSETLDDANFAFFAYVDYDLGFDRQNPLDVVDAFRAAFGPNEGPRLVIEAKHAERYPLEHARLSQAVAGRSDIELLVGVNASPGMRFEQRAPGTSCVVSLHRSEGTGHFLSRAMVAGVPTIVSAHSFSTELQGDLDSFQIACSSVPIFEQDHSAPSGAWAQPDLVEAADTMRMVVAHPTLATSKAERARRRGNKQFSPLSAARAMQERLATIDRERVIVGASLARTSPLTTTH
jgi:GT2 family glycosyltransferase